MPDWTLIAVAAPLGLVAGLFGGMLGVGGSVVMIPGLTLAFGTDQHLYQAAAMIANVAVSVPAAIRHHRAGATVPAALRWMLPAALAAVIAGVGVSNLPTFQGQTGGVWLGRLLAGFLVYVIIENIRRLSEVRARASENAGRSIVTPARSGGIGLLMGGLAGLLGIGGGALAVPLQQVVMRLPIRSAIANSSLVICISAAVGSVYKNASLGQHGVDWRHSLMLAACLAPTCAIGGHLGASLTHRLSVRHVRVAFIGLMIVAAWRMLALPWP